MYIDKIDKNIEHLNSYFVIFFKHLKMKNISIISKIIINMHP